MITEALLGLAEGITLWFITLFPDMSGATDLVVTADGFVGSLLAGASGLGAWFPWTTLVTTIPVVLSTYMLLLFFKAFRNMFSHFPVFGGNG